MPRQPKQNVSETVSQRIEEALQPLSSGPRLKIIQALHQMPEYTATFSELQEAVGVSDSGQFSYHLRQLTEDFVRQTDRGYELRIAGIALYRSLLLGIPLKEVAPRSFSTGSDCPDCDSVLQATYENDNVTVSCPECGLVLHDGPFPPGGVEGKNNKSILRTFDRRMRSFIELSTNGVCPWCYGTMELELRFDDESRIKRYHQVTGHFLNYTCKRCGGHCLTTIGEGLLTHPAVISFYYEHDRDITEIPLWDLDFCMDDRMVTVISDDPIRMTIDIELDEDGLQLTVDGQLSVLNIETTTV